MASNIPGVSYVKSQNALLDVGDLSNKCDVGSIPGTQWKLSSHKPGAGVSELRDPDLSHLWQSDGVQPHVVDILFPRRTAVTHISIYLDVTLDDSYTPTRIGIKAGTYFHDLAEVQRQELGACKGWVHFVLNPPPEAIEEPERTQWQDSLTQLPRPIWVYHLQVCIYANHLNGKDTHLRAVRVFGPPEEPGPTLPGRTWTGGQKFQRGDVSERLKPRPPGQTTLPSDGSLPQPSRRSRLLHMLR